MTPLFDRPSIAPSHRTARQWRLRLITEPGAARKAATHEHSPTGPPVMAPANVRNSSSAESQHEIGRAHRASRAKVHSNVGTLYVGSSRRPTGELASWTERGGRGGLAARVPATMSSSWFCSRRPSLPLGAWVTACHLVSRSVACAFAREAAGAQAGEGHRGARTGKGQSGAENSTRQGRATRARPTDSRLISWCWCAAREVLSRTAPI